MKEVKKESNKMIEMVAQAEKQNVPGALKFKDDSGGLDDLIA